MIGAALLCAAAGLGHVNSPHIYLEERIGPYHAILIVHMPPAVPGEAEVQVRVQDRSSEDPVRILVREIPPQGEQYAPPWRVARPYDVDPDFYTAPFPLTVYGLWHAEVKITGSRGEGSTRVPIPARVPVPRKMPLGLTGALILLAVLLYVSFWSILKALGRDAHRHDAEAAAPSTGARGLIWAVAGVTFFTGFLSWTGYNWFRFNALRAVRGGSGEQVELAVTNPPALAGKRLSLELGVRDRKGRPIEGVAPDHGKMMHMAVVKLPDASYFLHVHPRLTGPGRFAVEFTPPEPGTYRLFGDILYSSGEGVTVTGLLEVGPGSRPSRYGFRDPDDSHAFPPPFGDPAAAERTREVGDGLVMRWVGPDKTPLETGDFMKLEFRLENAGGDPVEAIEPYMGMAGHLMILRDDANVFAHVHPMGTLSGRMGTAMEMPSMLSGPLPPRASFPYGFPEDGFYRLFVQMKHQGKVYTGVFDTRVN